MELPRYIGFDVWFYFFLLVFHSGKYCLFSHAETHTFEVSDKWIGAPCLYSLKIDDGVDWSIFRPPLLIYVHVHTHISIYSSSVERSNDFKLRFERRAVIIICIAQKVHLHFKVLFLTVMELFSPFHFESCRPKNCRMCGVFQRQLDILW